MLITPSTVGTTQVMPRHQWAFGLVYDDGNDAGEMSGASRSGTERIGIQWSWGGSPKNQYSLPP